MATRSRIGITNSDGTFTSIYCHWDGYPSHHGPILIGNYSTEERVRALIALGGISELHPLLTPVTDIKHDFDNKVPGVVVAYHRDRNEDWNRVQPKTSWRKESLCSEEYGYLFTPDGSGGGAWVYTCDGADWQPLTAKTSD